MLHSTGQPQRSEVDPRLMVKLNKEETSLSRETNTKTVSLTIQKVQGSDSEAHGHSHTLRTRTISVSFHTKGSELIDQLI